MLFMMPSSPLFKCQAHGRPLQMSSPRRFIESSKENGKSGWKIFYRRGPRKAKHCGHLSSLWTPQSNGVKSIGLFPEMNVMSSLGCSAGASSRTPGTLQYDSLTIAATVMARSIKSADAVGEQLPLDLGKDPPVGHCAWCRLPIRQGHGVTVERRYRFGICVLNLHKTCRVEAGTDGIMSLLGQRETHWAAAFWSPERVCEPIARNWLMREGTAALKTFRWNDTIAVPGVRLRCKVRSTI